MDSKKKRHRNFRLTPKVILAWIILIALLSIPVGLFFGWIPTLDELRSPAYNPGVITDVENHQAVVYEVLYLGLMLPTSESTFSPDALVSREDFIRTFELIISRDDISTILRSGDAETIVGKADNSAVYLSDLQKILKFFNHDISIIDNESDATYFETTPLTRIHFARIICDIIH